MSQEAEAPQGPQLHSFQPVAVSHQDNDTIVEDDGNSTIPEDQDQNESKTNDTEEEARSPSVQLLSKEILPNPIHEVNDVNIIDVSENDEEGEGEDGSSGTSVLPLSKIKKIFKTDPEHVSASEAAVFTTAIATELFIQYFTEQASLIARSEKRKKLQYKDFASAVSGIEQLHFLSDIVPKTYNLKSLVENDKVNYAPGKKEQPLGKGQGTLNFGKKASGGTVTKKSEDTEDEGEQEDNEELPESDDDNDAGRNYIKQAGENLSDGDEENDDEDERINGKDDDYNNANINDEPVRRDRDHDVIMN